MKEQIYRVEEVKSFEPKHIFECGQCFRWNKERDNSYTGIIGKNILNVKKENGIEELCIHYFDLHTNYEKIKQTLAKVDENM